MIAKLAEIRLFLGRLFFLFFSGHDLYRDVRFKKALSSCKIDTESKQGGGSRTSGHIKLVRRVSC
jgi:hypothetical protein